MKHDLGESVGKAEEYEKLTVEVFGKANVKPDLRTDCFCVPYSLVVMVLEKTTA